MGFFQPDGGHSGGDGQVPLEVATSNGTLRGTEDGASFFVGQWADSGIGWFEPKLLDASGCTNVSGAQEADTAKSSPKSAPSPNPVYFFSLRLRISSAFTSMPKKTIGNAAKIAIAVPTNRIKGKNVKPAKSVCWPSTTSIGTNKNP